jgi:hypothetical protein
VLLVPAGHGQPTTHFIALYGVARSNQLYLLIYMALVLLFVGLLLTRDTVFSVWTINASTNLHNREWLPQ